MEIAVLGGGIAGLATAYRLARQGQSVTLFEASDRLGGLGTWFEYEGLRLDRFYHVILDSDSQLLRLLDELGLAARIRWSETKMGFFVRGQCYPFNSAVDLLRFRALGLIDRLRTGFAALCITKLWRNGLPLDDQLAHVWLRKLFGPRVYQAIWEPLLTAKFGDLRDRVPAYWVWNTLNREKNGSQEVKGYVQGGYACITDHLAAAIEQSGGTICLHAPVRTIQHTPNGVNLTLDGAMQDFDAVVSTLPLPLLKKVAVGQLAARIPLPDLAYQGVVNVMMIQREPLDQYYWTAVVNSDFPFQGVVETTRVIDPAWLGGRHLIYAMNYCSADSPLYNIGDAELKQQALNGLRRLYPRFDPASVEAMFVFRTPHVEPVWTTGYLRQRPPSRIPGTRLFLATTAQAYPMVTSWNTSVTLSEEAVEALLTAADLTPDAASPASAGAAVPVAS